MYAFTRMMHSQEMRTWFEKTFVGIFRLDFYQKNKFRNIQRNNVTELPYIYIPYRTIFTRFTYFVSMFIYEKTS